MQSWNRFKKLIFGDRCRQARPAAPRPPSSRTPSRRARQAEQMALYRLGRDRDC